MLLLSNYGSISPKYGRMQVSTDRRNNGQAYEQVIRLNVNYVYLWNAILTYNPLKSCQVDL